MPRPVLTAANDELEVVARVLDHAPPEVAEAPVPETAPEVMRLAVVTRELTLARSVIETELARRLGDNIYEGDGYVLRRRWSTPRKNWDDPALRSRMFSEILMRACYDREGNRIGDPDTAQRVIDLFDTLFNLTGRTVRVTALRSALDIEPNRYAETEPSRPSLEIIT